MKTASVALGIIVATLAFYPHGARADFFSDVARVITAPVVAPVEATVRILRNDNPTEAVTGPFQSAGRIVTSTADTFQKANDVFNRIPRDVIDNTLGGDWSKAYGALTASQRVQFELATTSGRFLGRCMQGQACGVNELVAGPVAAALRDAYKAYIGHAAPLDPRLSQILSRVVPPQVLAAARVTVGATPDFTVPGFLNAGYSVAGKGHAVAIGNLIIFSRALNFSDRQDWNWLLHELRHTEQYMRYSSDVFESIDGFAVNYTFNFEAVEADAQNTADSRQRMLDEACRSGC